MTSSSRLLKPTCFREHGYEVLNPALPDEWTISLGGTAEVRSSVFLGNVVGNTGGAIAKFGSGTLHLKNCTIVQNSAAVWAVGPPRPE